MLRTAGLLLGLGLWLYSCKQHSDVSVERHPGSVIESGNTISLGYTDTAEIHKISRSAFHLINTQVDSAIALYTQALILSKQSNYYEGAASAFNNLMICYYQKTEYGLSDSFVNEAIVYLEKAIRSQTKLNHGFRVRQLYPFLQSFYFFKGYPGQVVKAYNLAAPFFDKSDSLQNSALISMSEKTAWAYFVLGQYDSASNLYTTLLSQLSVNKHTYKSVVRAYLGIGDVSLRIAAPEKAAHYFNQAQQLAESYKDTSLLVRVVGSIANLKFNQKDYDAAKKFARKSLMLAERYSIYNEKFGTEASNAFTLAASLIEEDSALQALPYSEMALKASQKVFAVQTKVMAYSVAGYNYVKLKAYDKAKLYLDSALNLAIRNNIMDHIINTHGQLGMVYYHTKAYKEAYDHVLAYAKLKDSTMGKENAARITEIESKYQVEKKNNELLAQQVKIAQQQKLHLILAAVIVLMAVISIAIFIGKKRKKTILHLQGIMEGEERERSRLAQELHDGIVSKLSIIKMSFSALSGQRMNKSEIPEFLDIVEDLEQSIAELRATTHNLLPEILQRAGLEEALRIYCRKVSKGTPVDLSFEAIGNLPEVKYDFQLNVYRIIQELINNMIKYAHASRALLQMQTDEEWLNITIVDNGSNSPGNDNKLNNGSIGLQSLKKRIRLLNGSLETEAGRKGGTSVYLEFHLKKFIHKP